MDTLKNIKGKEEFKPRSRYTFDLDGKVYIREVYSITDANRPFIKTCLDRIYIYPVGKKKIVIEGVGFTEQEYEEIIKIREWVKGKTILFMGPSNSGKGFYGKRIARVLGLKHISFGDLVREVGRSTTDIGLRMAIEKASKEGELLPDKIAESILREGLNDIKEGIILDGFPRTVEQVRVLDRIRPVDLVILLEVPEEMLYDLIEARVVCEKCGEVYSRRFTRPKDREFRCDVCGGELIRRATPDGKLIDTRETLTHKLRTYKAETVPVMRYYSNRGIVRTLGLRADSDVPEDLLEKEYDESTGERKVYVTKKGNRVLATFTGIKRSFGLFKTPIFEDWESINDFVRDNPDVSLKEIEDRIDEKYNVLVKNVRAPPHILSRWRVELFISAFKDKDPSYSWALYEIYTKLNQPEIDLPKLITNLSQKYNIPVSRFYKAISPNYNEATNTIGIFEFNFNPDDYFRIMKLGIDLQGKRIIIQGPPGSGKGFWGERLAGIFGMEHISFGDKVREIGRTTNDEELKRAIQGAVDKGGVIPDEYAFRIVEEIINQNSNGFILEGFPRTVRQAEWLVEKINIDAVIEVSVPMSLLADRVQNRVVCPECGMVHNLLFDELSCNESGEPVCLKDGNPLARRKAPDGSEKDTNNAVFGKRLRFYSEKTVPVLEVFSRGEKLYRISNRVLPDEDVPDEYLQEVNIGGRREVYRVEEDGELLGILNENGLIVRWLDFLEEIVSQEKGMVKLPISEPPADSAHHVKTMAPVQDKNSIYARECLTFEEYASFSLYDSHLGYFSSDKVIFGPGEEAHFSTYPELLARHKGQPFFGGMTAEQIFKMWKGMVEGGSLAKGEEFTIMEFGGGNGRYALEILSYIRQKSTEDPEWGDFYNAVKCKMVDIARDTEDRIRPGFIAFGDKFTVEVGDARTLHDPMRSNIRDNSINGVILSCELIDNIPPHKVRLYPDGKAEVAVAMPKSDRFELARFLKEIEGSDSIRQFEQIDNDLVRLLGIPPSDDYFYLGKRGLWLLEDLVRGYLQRNPQRKEEIDRMYQKLVSFDEEYIPSRYFTDVEQSCIENKSILDDFRAGLEKPRVVYLPVGGASFIKSASRILNKGYVVTMDYGGLFSHQYEYGFNEPFRTFPEALQGGVKGDFYKVFLRGDLTYDVPFDLLIETGKRSGLGLEIFGKVGLLACGTSYEDWLGYDRLRSIISEIFKEVKFGDTLLGKNLERVIGDLVLRNYRNYYRSMTYDPRYMQLLVQKKVGTSSTWCIRHPIIDKEPPEDLDKIYRERTKAIECVKEVEERTGRYSDEDRYKGEDEREYANAYLQEVLIKLHPAEYLRYLRRNLGVIGVESPIEPIGPRGRAMRYADVAKGFICEYELEFKIDDTGFVLQRGSETQLSELLIQSFIMLNQAVENSIDMERLWQDIINNSDNRGSNIVIRVSSTLPENSARYYNSEIGKVEIIFNLQFIENLLKTFQDHVTVWLMAERLFHELGHDDREGTNEEERAEEKRQILRDVVLYLLLSGELKETISGYFDTHKPKFPSGYYFRDLIGKIAEGFTISDIPNILKGIISDSENRLIDEFLDRSFGALVGSEIGAIETLGSSEGVGDSTEKFQNERMRPAPEEQTKDGGLNLKGMGEVEEQEYEDLQFVDMPKVELDPEICRFHAIGVPEEEMQELNQHILFTKLVNDTLLWVEQKVLSKAPDLMMYYDTLFERYTETGPTVVLRISENLNANSSHFYNTASGISEKIFSLPFVQDLLQYYEKYPIWAKAVLFQRLFHELGHDYEGQKEAELIERDMQLLELYEGLGIQDGVDTAFKELHDNLHFKSGYYYYLLKAISHLKERYKRRIVIEHFVSANTEGKKRILDMAREAFLTRNWDKLMYDYSTYFFWNVPHYKWLKEIVLPRISPDKRKHFRVAVLGCCTGQEPISLAIWFLENGYKDFEIVSVDSNRGVLDIFEKGIYRKEEMAPFMEYGKQVFNYSEDRMKALTDTYFQYDSESATYRLREEIRERLKNKILVDITIPSNIQKAVGNADIVFYSNIAYRYENSVHEIVADGISNISDWVFVTTKKTPAIKQLSRRYGLPIRQKGLSLLFWKVFSGLPWEWRKGLEDPFDELTPHTIEGLFDRLQGYSEEEIEYGVRVFKEMFEGNKRAIGRSEYEAAEIIKNAILNRHVFYRIRIDKMGNLEGVQEVKKSDLYNEQYLVDALGDLVKEYEGSGILSGIKEIEIVDKDGSFVSRVDSKARIGIDTFRDKNLVIEDIEHEALREILGLIIPDNPILAEVVAKWYSVRRFLKLGEEERQRILKELGPNDRYTEFLKHISSSRLEGDDLIKAVIDYVKADFDVAVVKSADVNLEQAVKLFNELEEAGRLVGEVRETERRMINVIKTFNGIRIEGRIPSNIRRLIGLIARHDKWTMPEGTKVSGIKYVVYSKKKMRSDLEVVMDDIKKKYGDNIRFVDKYPEGVNKDDVIVLVDPEDAKDWKGQKGRDLFYLPLPYMRLSLYLAVEAVLTGRENFKSTFAYSFVKEFYRDLLNAKEITDDEIRKIFYEPWDISSRIILDELNILRDAVSQLDKFA